MLNSDKRRFKATIGGKEYVLVGKGSVEHMQAVTNLLNEQLNQLQAAMPSATDEQRAILIAFNAISKQFEIAAQLDKEKIDDHDVRQ
ncbi:cell division protein ZapA [Lentilactobacillus fungorum]|uniref:Cell division protein ZapA n=1 Tax=Lentilactobacillus fungorum TaxID=2201250 RepID=A0ABQ3VWL6_9LACO|nr:cell division protein ZapA [Lentilactobacillus fungorum]GHP12632.1 cell division protein ZapA [Lentilactobacillus fungorum]